MLLCVKWLNPYFYIGKLALKMSAFIITKFITLKFWCSHINIIILWFQLFFCLFFMDNCFGILLFSDKYQHESALGIHMSLPSWTSLPSLIPSHPSRLLQSTRSSLHHTAKFSLGIYFTYYNVYVSIHPSLSFPHCAHKSVLYVCVSIATMQIGLSVQSF